MCQKNNTLTHTHQSLLFVLSKFVLADERKVEDKLNTQEVNILEIKLKKILNNLFILLTIVKLIACVALTFICKYKL